MQVGFISLGCAKNQVDTEIMQGILNEHNYDFTENYQQADIIVLNTCGFIDAAKEESVDYILDLVQLKKEAKLKVLIVAGCLSQRYQESLKEEIPEIDAMLGTDTQDQIVEVIDSALDGKYVSKYERKANMDQLMPRKNYQSGPGTYIKIAEGCDNFCSYCAIPMIRGRYRSRPIEQIVTEAKSFISDGIKEITLIAQDTTYYGKDLYGEYSLDKLLSELAQIPGDFWIRILYTYPTRITDNLIEVMAKYEKICPYLDVPLQHIEGKILRAMNRPSDESNIKQVLQKLRNEIPGLTLRTSFIVGFPGESESDFQKLIEFMQEIEFDHAGVFKYSDEEDTRAYEYEDKVPENIKEERYKKAWEVQQEITRAKNEQRVGEVVPVLIEEEMKEETGTKLGRSKGLAPEVDGAIIIPDCPAEIGDFISVELIQALDYDLIGEMTNEFSE